jgi:excisionase family DNA binding protein
MRPPHLLTIRQAAKSLGVSRTTLRQMISLGQLPAWREGDRVYVDPMSAQTAISRFAVPRPRVLR